MSADTKNILVIGTADTKSAELSLLVETIKSYNYGAVIMDVGVLGEPAMVVQYTKHDVAASANLTIRQVIELGDENKAMIAMAQGAGSLALDLVTQNKIHGVIALGGSMGTDLALDVAKVLPIGFPKMLLSTIAYSHLIPPDRLAPDLMMMLWSGGLYGINSICRSTLIQAAGAVCGAVSAIVPNTANLPKVAISSFGKTAAKWMLRLVPELQQRGFEAVVFHATGMGGLALEGLAAKNEFVAVFDFALQEVTNHHFDSVVTAGADRLTHAGINAIPQIVAPGFIDLVDFPDWQEIPEALRQLESHSHNRLIASVAIEAEQRAAIVKLIAEKLSVATAPVAYLLPTKGIHEWDREGGILYDAKGIEAVNRASRQYIKPPIDLYELDCHINDDAFVDKTLAIFDKWCQIGVIKT